jgi:hypothetical protein
LPREVTVIDVALWEGPKSRMDRGLFPRRVLAVPGPIRDLHVLKRTPTLRRLLSIIRGRQWRQSVMAAGVAFALEGKGSYGLCVEFLIPLRASNTPPEEADSYVKEAVKFVNARLRDLTQLDPPSPPASVWHDAVK